MRSASLMRRIKELEEEEKKMIKNSLRLSRDSLINHQRRASQERLDENNVKKMKQPKTTAVQQLYGTLPKKQTANKVQQPPQQQQIKPQISPPNQIPVNLSEQVIAKVKSTNTETNNKVKQNKALNRNASSCSTSSIQSIISTASKEAQEANDQYAEIEDHPKVGAKQHKIRKKLLIGSFIKRKNRSLPDLTVVKDNSSEKSVDEVDCPIVSNEPQSQPDKQIIAKVSRKGFHQVHPQTYDQKISKELSTKLNQSVVAPKSPKPATPVKPTSIKSSATPTQSIDEVDNKVQIVEQELDLASLPPPPIEFLNELRANKEQMNNQINENIANEMKEKANRSTAVRNLATKFNQINMSSSTNKPPLPPIIKKLPSTSEQQKSNNLNNDIKPISPTQTSKQSSSTGLRVAMLGSRNQSSPSLIYKNHSTSPTAAARPERPPDYDTTIKRLNLIQQHHHQVQNAPRPSVESNYSLVSLPSSLNSSLDSPFKNNPNSSSLPLHQQQIQQLKQQQYNAAIAVRKNKQSFKKSVSFSDEVIIVAHPEDREEVHLPNPLLDRVLKQKSTLSNTVNSNLATN